MADWANLAVEGHFYADKPWWDSSAKVSKMAGLLKKSETPFSILWADYHLDEGSGIDAIRAVHAAIGAEVPAIIISADYTAEVQREIRAQGLGHLRKPIKAAALRAIVSQSVMRRAAAE